MITSLLAIATLVTLGQPITLPAVGQYPHDTLDRYGVFAYPFHTRDALLLAESRGSKHSAKRILPKVVSNFKDTPNLSAFLVMIHVSRRAEDAGAVLTLLDANRRKAWSAKQVPGQDQGVAIASLYQCYAVAVLGSFSGKHSGGHKAIHDVQRHLTRPLNRYERILYAMCLESRGDHPEAQSELLSVIQICKDPTERRSAQLVYAVSLRTNSAPPDTANLVFKEAQTKRRQIYATLCDQYPQWGEAAYFHALEYIHENAERAKRLLLVAVSDKSMNPELRERSYKILSLINRGETIGAHGHLYGVWEYFWGVVLPWGFSQTIPKFPYFHQEFEYSESDLRDMTKNGPRTYRIPDLTVNDSVGSATGQMELTVHAPVDGISVDSERGYEDWIRVSRIVDVLPSGSCSFTETITNTQSVTTTVTVGGNLNYSHKISEAIGIAATLNGSWSRGVTASISTASANTTAWVNPHPFTVTVYLKRRAFSLLHIGFGSSWDLKGFAGIVPIRVISFESGTKELAEQLDYNERIHLVGLDD
ncbi:hypothetical protein QPK87_37235 [Kamptonema cortianum]|nr:hypothetical protein [Geitlerinema splendidum]MDK3162153.1 hypothetical protein [Kamptonema cortianum]